MIRLSNITKEYRMGGEVVKALAGLSFHVGEGDYVAIMGPSGSGKSTLMNILGCLDKPTSGRYELAGEDVSKLAGDQLADVRNRRIGFVFQSFNLLPMSSAAENVALPLMYAGARNARARALKALERVGLGARANHRPNEMSGGQRQRVAIARALVTAPAVILADEPTGNLDTKTGIEILGLFEELHAEGSTIMMVTHEPDVAEYTQRIVTVRDGLLGSDEPVGKRRRSGLHAAIVEDAVPDDAGAEEAGDA
jgi:putative ABC transport system ATP-binding protein